MVTGIAGYRAAKRFFFQKKAGEGASRLERAQSVDTQVCVKDGIRLLLNKEGKVTLFSNENVSMLSELIPMSYDRVLFKFSSPPLKIHVSADAGRSWSQRQLE